MKEYFKPRVGQVNSSDGSGVAHILRWTEWGDPKNPKILVCAHGLTRSGRDFDFLAQELATEYRVICPDYPGRGASDWLKNKAAYHNPQYLQDTINLLNALDFKVLDWVGTSMGGLIGMALAAMPDNPIRKMVINDVGPYIPADALNVIALYLSAYPDFPNLDEAIVYYKNVYASFGALEEKHYTHMANYGTRKNPSGEGYLLHYDPAMIEQFISPTYQDVELWDIFDQIDIPLLILRGKKSGLLLPQTVEQMKYRNDSAMSVEFDGCAHAPSLMVEDQINVVKHWLTS